MQRYLTKLTESYSSLLQYKGVCIIDFDKLQCEMLKNGSLMVFFSILVILGQFRHQWRHIRMQSSGFTDEILRWDLLLFFKRVILKAHRSTVAAAVVLLIGHQILRRLTSRPIVCMSTGCFPDMTSSLAKCKQTSGAHLKDDFLTNCLFLWYSSIFQCIVLY